MILDEFQQILLRNFQQTLSPLLDVREAPPTGRDLVPVPADDIPQRARPLRNGRSSCA